MEHTNRPQQVPKAPRPPITPRSENGMRHRPKTPITPRASSGLDAPEDQSYPIPPTPRGRDNHYKTMVNHDQGGVKRSPSGTESSGDEPAFDKNIRSSVAVNKRRKNEMVIAKLIFVFYFIYNYFYQLAFIRSKLKLFGFFFIYIFFKECAYFRIDVEYLAKPVL